MIYEPLAHALHGEVQKREYEWIGYCNKALDLYYHEEGVISATVSGKGWEEKKPLIRFVCVQPYITMRKVLYQPLFQVKGEQKKPLIRFVCVPKFKMTIIWSNLISQRAVKAWIIANCIEFIIWIFKLVLVYDIK